LRLILPLSLLLSSVRGSAGSLGGACLWGRSLLRIHSAVIASLLLHKHFLSPRVSYLIIEIAGSYVHPYCISLNIFWQVK